MKYTIICLFYSWWAFDLPLVGGLITNAVTNILSHIYTQLYSSSVVCTFRNRVSRSGGIRSLNFTS